MKIIVKENSYKIDVENLVSIGKRVNNKKRNFLFISKVLGKHIEVKPDICRAMGFLLASMIYGRNNTTDILINYLENPSEFQIGAKKAMNQVYKQNEKVAILGFAETATGLGMAVASSIEKSYYITTTRENVKGLKSILNFEEEHSHAITHKCFPENPYKLKNADRIILVDDEITTGKSMLNIITELIKTTNVKKYTILTILDWRNITYKNLLEDFMNKNNVSIEVKALISGEIQLEENITFYDKEESILEDKTIVTSVNILARRDSENLKFTGRFGVEFHDIEKLEEDCKKVAGKIEELLGAYKKILVLGHGENIYIPSRIASYIKGDVYFKSTTRSPIYCSDENNYIIKEKNSYYHNGVKYYFYNKSKIEETYDKVVLITEDNLNIKLTKNIIIVKL